MDNQSQIPAQRRPVTRRWYHWHNVGATKNEKQLLRKLDFYILFYTCLTFFVKYLDQTNVTNAYLTGMKHDLQLNGNQLNWFTTYFSVGIIIGAPISTCMLTIVQPRYWLPFCTMVWSFFVLFMYKAESARTLYALRFCCGLFEAGAYPGSLYLIGNWYTRSEISRRTGIFLFSSILGSMCSGYIQAGLHKNMDGVMGLASWRWLFIFDFILSIPVALFGFLVCPDEPKGKKIWWMKEEEKRLSIERMKLDGRDATGTWSWSVVITILKSWQVYTFVIAWALVELTCGNQIMRWMGLWLKDQKLPNGKHRFSDEQVNALPTLVGVVELIFIFGSSVAADALDNRSLPFAFLSAMQLFSYIVLLVDSSNRNLRMAAYYLGGAYGGLSPLLGGWISCSCGGNKQLRSFVTAIMISVGYAVEAPAQQTVFPTKDSPYFRHSIGYSYGVGMIVATAIWCAVALPIIPRVWPIKQKELSVSGYTDKPYEDATGASTTVYATPKPGNTSE